jgi:acetyl esterase
MPIHAEYQALLDMMALVAADAPPLEHTTPEMSRQAYAGLAAVAGPGPDVAVVYDRTINGQAASIPIRVYRPVDDDTFTGAVMFFHGGGFVIGDLDTHDAVCRELCVGTGCTVIAVDYRLAPEHRFPAAVEDCWDATRWVVDHADELHIDPARLVVAGDSAGGNLAAVIALLARQHGGPDLALQVLVYPAVDGADGGWQSRVDNAEGYLLTAAQMDWFVDHYVPSVTLRNDWRVAPLRAASHDGLAPALVITAEFDPLRDEGAAYAAALQASGVPVQHSLYDGAIHVFFQLPGTELGRRAMNEVCAAIRDALA